jgi:hypothetical protein
MFIMLKWGCDDYRYCYKVIAVLITLLQSIASSGSRNQLKIKTQQAWAFFEKKLQHVHAEENLLKHPSNNRELNKTHF